jgi:NAD(P)-dependent dehydrogenase (short-subunit alcohol dehydrogenase family)
VRSAIVDVSSRESIEELVASFVGPLHVLINNAAIAPRRRETTPEGIERQFATNVLGYLRMTQAFADLLARSAPSRVVNVASYWAGDLDMDDLEFRRRRYDNDAAYRQSKQANRMLTVALADELAPRVTVNACHPGDVDSKLSADLGFGGHESPESGADTPVFVATDPTGQHVTGAYFEHRRAKQCRFGADREAVRALYALCRDRYGSARPAQTS